MKNYRQSFCFSVMVLSLLLIQSITNAAETVTYSARDTGFLRHGTVTDILTKAVDESVGYVSGGAGGVYLGYIDFLCDPPFYIAHPGANIRSVTLKLNLTTPNPQIANAQYKVVNLESLLNQSSPDTVADIDANNSGTEIYNAFNGGNSMGSFSGFSQVPGTAIEISLSKDLVDFSSNTKNYYVGLREEGDDDGVIVFYGINDTPVPELVITYDYSSGNSSFSWPAVLPAIIKGRCGATSLSGCRTQESCFEVGGIWTGEECTACPYTGNYSGTWSELSCDLLRYNGGWTGTVDENCYFIGIDDQDEDFLKGSIEPQTGRGISLTGIEEDCGPLTGTAVFSETGVQGTYSGAGVSGTYSGTRQ